MRLALAAHWARRALVAVGNSLGNLRCRSQLGERRSLVGRVRIPVFLLLTFMLALLLLVRKILNTRSQGRSAGLCGFTSCVKDVLRTRFNLASDIRRSLLDISATYQCARGGHESFCNKFSTDRGLKMPCEAICGFSHGFRDLEAADFLGSLSWRLAIAYLLTCHILRG